MAGLALAATPGCAYLQERARQQEPQPDRQLPQYVRLTGSQSVEGLGRASGAFERDGFVYLTGDANTGVIRQYRLDRAGESPQLRYTGVEIKLTKDGQDLIPSPTGVTYRPESGTWIGNSVRGRGTLFHVDFDKLLADRTLDRAVRHTVNDDAAVRGSRPEFVQANGRWLLATADASDTDASVRLYDPAELARAASTKESGVLVSRFRCGPRVRSLSWVPGPRLLAVGQNRETTGGWRVTFAPLEAGDDLRRFRGVDLPPASTLAGLTVLSDGRTVVMVSPDSAENVRFGEIVDRP